MMRRLFLRSMADCLFGLIAASSILSSQLARAEQIGLDVSLAQPTVLAGEKQVNYLKIKLNGFDLPSGGKRTPVNVAIVMDKSGSMTDRKSTRLNSSHGKLSRMPSSA